MNSVFVDKTATNSGQKKLVGVYISKIDADRLAMLSLKEGVPRTSILKQIVGGYLDDAPSLPVMIQSAIDRAGNAYTAKDNTKTIKQFCQQVRKDLISCRIDPQIIDQIIQGIDT